MMLSEAYLNSEGKRTCELKHTFLSKAYFSVVGEKKKKDYERDQNTLAGRITVRMEDMGLNPVDLSRAAEVSVSAAVQWLTGSSKNLKLEYFFAVADLLELEPRWLGIKEGPKELADKVAVSTRAPMVRGNLRETQRSSKKHSRKTG